MVRSRYGTNYRFGRRQKEVCPTSNKISSQVWIKTKRFNPYLVEFEQSLEVDEDALGRFRAQKAFDEAGRTDRSAEHQVELHRVAQLVAGEGSFHFKLPHDDPHLFLVHAVQLDDDVFALEFYFRRGLLVHLDFFQMGLDQVIQAETFAGLFIFDHQIGKTIHMARRPVGSIP